MKKIKEWINNFDIWIVSCGGVGSNYIGDLLYKNGINVNCRKTPLAGHGQICHLNHKVIPDKKCIYVYGDYEWAIKSQERRKLLNTNIQKLRQYYSGDIPDDDPFLYKYQYENFKNTENTYLLKYPYTKQDLLYCFAFFDILKDIDKESIKIKKRTTTETFKTNYQKEINLYNFYKN